MDSDIQTNIIKQRVAAWEQVSLSSLKFESGERSEGIPILRGATRLLSGRGIALYILGCDTIERKRTIAYALDHGCYHHGGPLADGDIEEIPGIGKCVLCPWHKYLISIKSGEALYVGISIDPSTGKKIEEMKTKGIKQRAHPCRIVRIQQFGDGDKEKGFFSGVQDEDEDVEDDNFGIDDDIINKDGTINPAYVIEVLDMGTIESEEEAFKLGGKRVLKMFKEQQDQQLKEAKGGGTIQSDYYAPKPFNTLLAPSEDGSKQSSYPLHSSLLKPLHLRSPPQLQYHSSGSQKQ